MKPRQAPTVQRETTPKVPVQFPLVEMRVNDDGTMSVRLDGALYTPPPHAPSFRRESFSGVLDAITARLASPVKVVVSECDGTTFTDIVIPRQRPVASANTVAEPSPPPSDFSAPPSGAVSPVVPPVPVTGSGFLAGEDVAIAVIVSHCGVSPNGQVTALIPPEFFPHLQNLLLIGRISGTIQQPKAAS
ncbi:hypothetical protein G7066_08900 [Leucobacter coleopterorum]|uniref:Uncharacterized protein n=1 Tax=Leucobacter coleopterorum TaxID=2714933 RepID=A0ABX6JWL8_9MICO|nr:hypothetical protein [Leucobacter coleopterorum]QIM18699.1 hypothetical protein G7066_08900 [Leucobacter coleopterorum]